MRPPYSWEGSGNRGRGPARAVGANEYVVLFVAVVYFLGGYVLGRYRGRGSGPTHVVDPDPRRIDRGDGFANVIPFPRGQRESPPDRSTGAGRAWPDRRSNANRANRADRRADGELDGTRPDPQS